jgi:hypothetical protein
MARVPYSLREVGQTVSTDVVQYTGSSFSAASLSDFTGEEFFLEAVVTDYDKVVISWNSPIFEITDTARPVETFIRWSLDGEPQTIEDGLPLTNSTLSGSYTHTPDSGNTWQGKWVYYSLFLKYASTNTSVFTDGEQYYEKVASLSVLVTKNYGSIDDLWTRIPEYYRLQDADNEYLYNFLSIFAWDLDTLRTVIDYTMIQKDPQVASSYTLQQMMQELGTVITTVELGAIRARNYMEDIFNQRLSKGTEAGIISAIQAISGSQVTIDNVTKEIQVAPQRVNWIRDPKVAQTLVNGWYTAASPSSDVSLDATEIYFYGDPVGFNGASLSFGTPRDIFNSGSVNADLYIYGNYTVPFQTTDTFYFSTQDPDDSTIQKVALYMPDGTLAASAGPETPDTVLTRLGGETFYKLDMSSAPSDGEFYIFLYLEIPANGSLSLRNMLLEKEYIGPYFDGYTNTGGWLTGSVLRSDYRWSSFALDSEAELLTFFGDDLEFEGDALYISPDIDYVPVPDNQTYSLYSADNWRTRKTLEKIYKTFLPVNWQDIYSIVFDKMPYQYPIPVAPSTLPIDVGNVL